MTDLSPLDSSWVLLCAFLVVTLQIGFCMREAGLVRQKNSIHIAFKNLMTFVVSSLVYWLVGYGIMFGAGNASGLFGTDLFLKAHGDGAAAFFLFQLAFCNVAAIVVAGALAERTRLVACLIIAALMSAVFYPFVGHWVWGGMLENGPPGWLAGRGFIDFAGSSVVHGTAGWLALAAVLVVGPRFGRFDGERPRRRANNYPVATVGVLVLWFGWFGVTGGSTFGYDENIAKIVLNTSLSAAAGGLTLLSFAWATQQKSAMLTSLNGTVAGLVGVAAGCHLYETTDAIIIGVLAATACGLAMSLLERLRVDDVVGIWPAHAVAGLIGTLFVAVLGDTASFPLDHSRLEQLGVQAVGAAAVAAWAFGGGYVVLWSINQVVGLRVSAEHEQIGLDIAEHGSSTELVELLAEMGSQQRAGNFSSPVAVDPCSDVGRIATAYNRVLERVQLEIDSRDKACKQLEEASEFRFIFENAHEGIVQFARDGQVLKANPAAVALLGHVSGTDLTDKAGRWLIKLDNMDRTQHVAMLRKLEARGVAREVELSFTRFIDGRTGHVQLDLQRIPGKDGTPTTVLCSIIDIGERKSNDRLRVERDAARAASHAKSEFLANMSHEIRTPLNGVTGMLELLGRTELDTRQQRYVNIAGTSANALLSVINDILDVSKIEAGRLELERTVFTLPELLADVVDMFAPQAAMKGIELASLVPNTIPSRVIGDSERLRQVLVNLLGNAVKFTEQGAVTLRCKTTRLGRDEAAFRIDVEDSGPGILPSERDRLFLPFTQADSSTTRKHGGTGLGLTISRQLISLMGGDITVESEPGRGTVFHVDLPLPLAEPIDPAPLSVGRRTDATLPPRENIRVLAVDDHAVNLELLSGLLEPEGFDVGCVGSAESAMSKLTDACEEGRPYTLALLDFQMPGTDGEELARAIRADRRFEQLRIVMLTSIDQAITASERARLRIHASITKPLRRSRLFDAIHEALGQTVAGQTFAERTTRDRAAVTGSLIANGNAASSPDATHDRSLTILVVEDNPVNQMVTEELLLASGHVVMVADNGAEALEHIKSAGDIEMVLMDCQMSIMDGFEATRRIREIEAESGRARIPVIAVTANAIKGDRERCLAAGMDDYVTKPINVGLLEAAIRRHRRPV